MSELNEELERLDFDYEEELVEVTPYKDKSDLRFDGIHYNLIGGRPAMIPFWIAKILQEQDIIEFTSEKSESFHQIKGLTQSQRNSPQIIPLDDLTYRMFLKEIDNLKSYSKSTVNVFKLKSIEKNFKELLQMRTNKLLEMVRTDQKMNNKNLTSEEDWFFNNLNRTYTEWKQSVGQNIDDNYPVRIQALTSISVPYDINLESDPSKYSTVEFSINENEEKEVPLYLAKRLQDKMLVTITSSSFVDKDKLNDIADAERRDESMLTKIDPLLYHFLIDEIKRLEKRKSSINLSKISEYSGAFNFILRIRIRKILKHITDPNSINIEYITPEEKLLYNEIKRVYDDWQYQMANEEKVSEPVFDDITEEAFTQRSNDSSGDTPNEWGAVDPEELAYLEQLEQARNSGSEYN